MSERRGDAPDALYVTYPRIRFMGSKHRLAPRLAEVFATLPPGPAIDAFSGSGVVAYTLKTAGREVLANDHLTFTATLAEALVANGSERLTPVEVDAICAPSRDGRDFIARTFDGLYFPAADHAFLDSAWSHVDELHGAKRALALSALCLAAAQKQPRGVFTVTTPRYDDGRRQFRMSLRELFREAVEPLQRRRHPGHGARELRRRLRAGPGRRGDRLPRPAVRPAPRRHLLRQALPLPRGPGDVLAGPGDHVGDAHAQAAQAPYAVRLQTDRPVRSRSAVRPFRAPETLVVSYGSNADLDAAELEALLARHRRSVRRIEIPHRYAFGTHRAAERRVATEYVFVGR